MDTRIKEWRKTLGWTRQELASKLGMSIYTIIRWEQGKFKPSRLAIDALKRLGFKQ